MSRTRHTRWKSADPRGFLRKFYAPFEFFLRLLYGDMFQSKCRRGVNLKQRRRRDFADRLHRQDRCGGDGVRHVLVPKTSGLGRMTKTLLPSFRPGTGPLGQSPASPLSGTRWQRRGWRNFPCRSCSVLAGTPFHSPASRGTIDHARSPAPALSRQAQDNEEVGSMTMAWSRSGDRPGART